MVPGPGCLVATFAATALGDEGAELCGGAGIRLVMFAHTFATLSEPSPRERAFGQRHVRPGRPTGSAPSRLTSATHQGGTIANNRIERPSRKTCERWFIEDDPIRGCPSATELAVAASCKPAADQPAQPV
jgi:hypothetical protein